MLRRGEKFPVGPLLAVDAVGRDDIVYLPEVHDRVVLRLNLAVLLGEDGILVEQPEVATAHGACIYFVDHVKEAFEVFDLLLLEVVGHVDADCVHVLMKGGRANGFSSVKSVSRFFVSPVAMSVQAALGQ